MSPQSPSSEQLWILESLEEMQLQLVQIVNQANHSVFIFSRTLNPLLFNQTEIEAALSKTARSHRNAEIKIVVQQPQELVESNHLLLELARRLPSKIEIKRLTIDPPEPYEFVIVDNDKIWLQHKEGIYSGFANFDAKPEVKRFKESFSTLWKHSEDDPRLRRIIL